MMRWSGGLEVGSIFFYFFYFFIHRVRPVQIMAAELTKPYPVHRPRAARCGIGSCVHAGMPYSATTPATATQLKNK